MSSKLPSLIDNDRHYYSSSDFANQATSKQLSECYLIDTHTHFDAPVFDEYRLEQAKDAYDRGVRHLILVGYLHKHFERLYATQHMLNSAITDPKSIPQINVALGLHPFYIEQHSEAHLQAMDSMLGARGALAIGEIGLDTFTPAMKEHKNFTKQQHFFRAQLDMAVAHQLPVMLHIRKAHAEALAILKAHAYDAHKLGGIAHSFSGGEQEAKAFAKLGFKLGVTGQITNPNAKKLRRAIQAAVAEHGIECLVIETDCPDMTPIMCQHNADSSPLGHSPDDDWQDSDEYRPNVPANLPWVLISLSELLNIEISLLARQLWQNSSESLRTPWPYPTALSTMASSER